MNIIFFAGCLNKQKGLPLKQHYHFILRDMVRAKYGSFPGAQLENYQSYFSLAEKVGFHINQQPDIILLFLRPFPLHAAAKPLIRYLNKSGRHRLALHPALTKRVFTENVLDEFEQTDRQQPGAVEAVRLHLRRLNILGGKMLRLDSWAVEHITGQVSLIGQMARERGVKLIVAGPPLYPANSYINAVCIALNRQMELSCNQRGLPYAPLGIQCDGQGRNLLLNDGIHLSPAGHIFIAQTIFNIIG